VSSKPHDLPVSLYIVVAFILCNCIFIFLSWIASLQCYSFRGSKWHWTSVAVIMNLFVRAMETLSVTRHNAIKQFTYVLSIHFRKYL
jgi:hypothetical protein